MGEWTTIIGGTPNTGLTFSPLGDPVCETTYEFRVQARGTGTMFSDGSIYAAEWGEPSDTVSLTTGTCNLPPVFDQAT